MRTYRLEFIDTDNGVTVTGENDGFSVLELISMLELKKLDLIHQANESTKYARTAHLENGNIVNISEKEDSK